MSDYMVEESSGPKPVRYRPIVMWIHWISAGLIVWQWWLGRTFHHMPKGTAERGEMFMMHKTVGVVILLLALVRLGVRLMNPPPPYPQDMPKWERAFAVWTHRLFYFLLIALPATGLMLVSKGGATTELLGGINFPTIPLPQIGEAHEALVTLFIVLLALHVLGALKHQFIDKDATSARMWPFTKM